MNPATNPNFTRANAEARAKARTDALGNPESANAILANAYDDHNWTPAVLDTNTTEGIRNTLRAHASAIQALADQIDGVHKASTQPNRDRVQDRTYGDNAARSQSPADYQRQDSRQADINRPTP